MSLIFRYLFVLGMFVFTSHCIGAEPTIEVSGVQVVRQRTGEGFRTLSPFNSQNVGTSLTLFVRSPEASIIKLDIQASKIDAFVDSTKKSLLSDKPKKFGGTQEGFGPFPQISEDGKVGMVVVSGTGLPAKSASKIGVKGTLVVQLGSESATAKSDPVELSKGAQISVGGVDLKVAKIGKPSFGNDPVEVTFESKDKAVASLKGIKFFDASGKEIPSKTGGSSAMGFGQNYIYGLTIRFAKKLDGKVQIELDQWTDLKEAKIAISVSTGLGG